MLAAHASLPAAIRVHIDAILPPDPDRFAPPDDARVLRHFVATRAATPKGGSYLMPVAELINHGIERALPYSHASCSAMET